ncbi:MAG: SOS response-associated peptidase [Roseobacter sp.]
MCGRFSITLPNDAMAQLFDAQPDNNLPDVPNYNVCPTTSIHVVTGRAQGQPRRLVAMRWGLLPHWYDKSNDGPLLINARSETIAEKPAFRAAVRSRRCLVVVSGYYEWTKASDGSRDPWYIYAADAAPLVLAAIWQDWTDPNGETVKTCAVVTTAADEKMSRIHHRMPVVLHPDNWPLWLGEAGHGAAVLMNSVSNISCEMYRVDRAVNSNRSCGPSLIEPLPAGK